uniref:Uncharacterized protein n=1 Tax=Globodera rostochiensis TaxID=31243 RepID=A0A914HUE7_GLORO
MGKEKWGREGSPKDFGVGQLRSLLSNNGPETWEIGKNCTGDGGSGHQGTNASDDQHGDVEQKSEWINGLFLPSSWRPSIWLYLPPNAADIFLWANFTRLAQLDQNGIGGALGRFKAAKGLQKMFWGDTVRIHEKKGFGGGTNRPDLRVTGRRDVKAVGRGGKSICDVKDKTIVKGRNSEFIIKKTHVRVGLDGKSTCHVEVKCTFSKNRNHRFRFTNKQIKGWNDFAKWFQWGTKREAATTELPHEFQRGLKPRQRAFASTVKFVKNGLRVLNAAGVFFDLNNVGEAWEKEGFMAAVRKGGEIGVVRVGQTAAIGIVTAAAVAAGVPLIPAYVCQFVTGVLAGSFLESLMNANGGTQLTGNEVVVKNEQTPEEEQKNEEKRRSLSRNFYR